MYRSGTCSGIRTHISLFFQGVLFEFFPLADSTGSYMHFTDNLPVVWYFTHHILVDTGDSYEWVPYVFRDFEPKIGIEPM